MKHNITTAGQPCEHCKTPVEKKNRTNMKTKPGQEYYFLYWFYCPNCKAIYHVEDAKVYCDGIDYPTKGRRKSERCQCSNTVSHHMFDSESNSFTLVCCVDCKSVKYGG